MGHGGAAARRRILGGSVVYGSITGSFHPESWLLGLAGFPALLLTWQAWRARRKPDRLVAVTGSVGHLLTLAIFLVLYGTAWYAPPIGFVSDAALLYFGSSMLLAAYRGYAGCEVLSISNWVLTATIRSAASCSTLWIVSKAGVPANRSALSRTAMT